MKNKMLTKDLVQIAMTVALMVVFTLFVSIPLGPVPLTFQTIICVASGILLGSKKGAIAMAVYFFLGFVCHIPVFSGFTGGFASVFKPSFGYIIGFIPAEFISGFILEKSTDKPLYIYIIATIAGVLVNYIVGIPYFILIWKLYLLKDGLGAALVSYNLLYLPKDLILGVIGAIVCKQVVKAISKPTNNNND